MEPLRVPAKPKPAVSIDWEKIKSKVAAMQQIIDQKEIVAPDEKRSILKMRAAVLAGNEYSETIVHENVEVIVFRLAHERYGIETPFVREVYPLKEITVIPGTPAFVMGIMNVRGQIVSVIDLKRFFSLPERGLGELNKVIILSDGRMEFGILADVVDGTVVVAHEDILAVPTNVTMVGEKYLKGVTKEHIVILDVETIVNDESIIVNDTAV